MGAPKDNSAEVAAIEARAAREAREEQARKDAEARTQFDQRLEGAFGTGTQSAREFFQSQGLDPDQYAGKIQSAAQRKRAGVPLLDANPGSYFDDLGQQVYDTEQTGYRSKALRDLDSVAPTGFSTRRIDNTADDSTIEALLGEQLTEGEKYIQNLLDRGVITGGGFESAKKNLEGQKATARARLDTTGMGLLESGRGKADNIANAARSKASNLRLGEQFDPFSTGTELNNFFTDFFTKLGDNFRAAAPKDLFNTSGLAGVAGAAQGAGNTKFDPRALAGILPEEQKDEEDLTINPF